MSADKKKKRHMSRLFMHIHKFLCLFYEYQDTSLPNFMNIMILFYPLTTVLGVMDSYLVISHVYLVFGNLKNSNQISNEWTVGYIVSTPKGFRVC